MAIQLSRLPGFPAIAASALNVNAAVALVSGGDVARQVIPLATVNVEPFGVAQASAVNPGDAVTVDDARGTVVRVTAIASLGHGQDIGVASTNGGLAIVSAASGTLKYRVGQSLTAAAAGETFSLYINPKAISGNTP